MCSVSSVFPIMSAVCESEVFYRRTLSVAKIMVVSVVELNASVQQRRQGTDWENRYSEGNLYHCQFVHHRSHGLALYQTWASMWIGLRPHLNHGTQWRTERGRVWGVQTPPPPKFRSFDEVEPDCKLSRKCLVFLFQHPN